MIVDTSSVIAIIHLEPDAALYRHALSRAESCSMSMATLLEATIVAERAGGAKGGEALRAVIAVANITLIEVQEHHLAAAQEGWRRFGKGNHPVRLNFGDCFS